MSELVSVIIPVFRVEEFLRTCVDSVLTQTYGTLQVLLIDDGSPDRSGAICDEYAVADARVEVVHQENRGLSAARNEGLARARGEFVTFVDSDDWLHPGMVSALVDLAHCHDADLAICDFFQTDGEAEMSAQKGRESVLTNVEALRLLVGPTPDYVRMVVAWGKLYRRELFYKIDFPVGRFHEDEFTTHRILHRARRVVRTTAQLYYYRRHENSITATYAADKRKDARDAFRYRAAAFHDWGLIDEARAAYRRAFFLCIRDRSKLLASGDEGAVNSLDLDLAALVRDSRRVSQNWRFRAYSEVYAHAPGLMARIFPPRSDAERAAGIVLRGEGGDRRAISPH